MYAGEVYKGKKKAVQELEVGQMRSAKIVLGCSQRMSNAAVKAELGIPLPENEEIREKVQW